MNDRSGAVAEPQPVLEGRDLHKVYPVGGGYLRRTRLAVTAVDGVSFALAPGETLGLVGESGSGKSTVARLVTGLTPLTSGDVLVHGESTVGLRPRERRQHRRHIQIVFQDPLSSFDPLAPLSDSLEEPLVAHEAMTRGQRRERVRELVELVGMSPEHLARAPRQLSGGQLQRMAVARALAANPSIIVCDEAVSALDVSTQAQVVNLLDDLQRDLGVAYLFIAHDLSVVRHISDRIAVMYLGRVVELGPADDVCTKPLHPYTEALLSAIPVPDPRVQRGRERIVLGGDIPSPLDPPSGCRFHTRCPHVMPICREVAPEALAVGRSVVHCHLHTPGLRVVGNGATATSAVQG